MDQQIWYYSSWDINITSTTQYKEEFCLNTNSNWQCIHWLILEPDQSIQNYQLSQTEIYTNTAVFVIIIMLLVRLVKWIFRWILPSKWK